MGGSRAESGRAPRRIPHAYPLQTGQCGAVLAIGEDFCVDFVSRPDAFAALYPKLRAGYLLDALGHLDFPAAPPDAALSFVTKLASTTAVRRPSAGRGDDVRLHGTAVVGSGLDLDDELIQLSAFTAGAAERSGRIARPSSRR